jgi:hypothetical protein
LVRSFAISVDAFNDAVFDIIQSGALGRGLVLLS